MKSRNRVYTNGEITILWRAAECSHSTLCYRELRSVFDPSKRPWVNPKGASTEQIKKIIEKCPTMALTFKWNDPERNKNEKSPKLYTGDYEKEFIETAPEQPQTTKVNIRPNGPVVISGNFTLLLEDGSTARQSQMISLCRCGASGNMPYCDGAHFKIGFRG